MKVKNYIIEIISRKIREIRKSRSEAKAGYKSISAIEAYAIEEKLSIKEKRIYCERKAYAQLKYFPNLDNPKSYNEKLIWIALYYKNPTIKKCSDKFFFKEYLKNMVGEQYCVPTIGVFDKIEDINFDKLPDRFVMKSTAGWGGKQVIVVDDKKKVPIDKIKSKAASWLYPWNTYYYNNLCTTDDNIEPRIIVETNLSEPGVPLKDYKIFCFNGNPKYLLIVSDRDGKDIKKTFFDLADWSILPLKRKNASREEKIDKPAEIEKLVEISRRLSANTPLVRIDFFIAGGEVFVGEMTFYPGMFLRFEPKEWDYRWGELIDLGEIKNDK